MTKSSPTQDVENSTDQAGGISCEEEDSICASSRLNDAVEMFDEVIYGRWRLEESRERTRFLCDIFAFAVDVDVGVGVGVEALFDGLGRRCIGDDGLR